MTAETHTQIAGFIWSICNLLRGPYKRNEYRKVILPLTVLRRFDSLLAPTKAQVLAEHPKIKTKPETVVRSLLERITGRPFYNLSKLDLPKLLDDPNQLAPNLNAYINGFSRNVREIMERFAFDQQIARMAEKNLLYEVIKAFCDPKVDLTFPGLTPAQANIQMGYVFEELIRIGAEQSNEEAGEHFTPREVIKLMVNLLLSPEQEAIARAAARVAAPPVDLDARRHALETERLQTEYALARLTDAVAAGGAIATLVQAIRDQERRQHTIRAELDRRRVAPLNVRELQARLRTKAEEWKALLWKHAPIARQMVRKLVNGRIVFTPDRASRRYTFLTLTNFFSGMVCPQAVASPSTPSWNQIEEFLRRMNDLKEIVGFAA
jgi:hypothetical protein